MLLKTEMLESIRDKAFKKAQSEKDMYKAKPYYDLSFSVEKFLKDTTVRIRPVYQIPSLQQLEQVN